MFPISGSTGRTGVIEASGKNGSAWGSAESYNERKAIIQAAKQAPLQDIFETYDISLNKIDKKTICPFSFHAEHSASFNFYPETNSFYCFGCKNGGGPIEFIALYEGISKDQAIKQIVNGFPVEVVQGQENHSTSDHAKQQELILKFSELIREFLQTNKDEAKALEYAEKITIIFDTVNDKNTLTNDGLEVLINKLEKTLGKFSQWVEKQK